MLPKEFKENRASCIEVLFNLFKAVPSNYYQKEELHENDLTTTITQLQVIKQKLNKKDTGFDYVELSSDYLNAFDQKVFRAILQVVYNQKEVPLKLSDLTVAKSLNEEYISIERKLYSNSINIDINYFYKLINPKSKTRASSNLFKKLSNSLIRLSRVSLSFYTKDKSKIVSTSLLIFIKNNSDLFLQVHPLINAYNFESFNHTSLIKPKQNYYKIDNHEFFNLNNSIQQLLYSKIQYKFASMPKIYKEISFDFNLLKSQIFLHTNSKKTKSNQSSKLKNAIKELDANCSYSLRLEGTSRTLQLIVRRD